MFKRVVIILTALLFLQLPLFIQQYEQQLIGHVAELEWQVQGMKDWSAQTGKPIDQTIQKFLNSGDVDFVHQGDVMNSVYKRWEKLSHALGKLRQSSVFTRPWIFLFYSNLGIVQATWHTFSLGVTLTFEGVVYALVGMVVGYFVYLGILRVYRRLFPVREAKSEKRNVNTNGHV
ncbi:MAG: DUF2937 family protein [Parachlamydiaceae bacterium]|nr:DUF2937 family protein [Parachlamydiaceae bacterium]